MTLKEFLLKDTPVGALVHITDGGWNVGCTLIDDEDLFIYSLNTALLEKEVKSHKWGYTRHNTKDGSELITPTLNVELGDYPLKSTSI